MIVVTGPGRSGTSVVAALYRELGLDPGGTWYDRVNAGFEDPDVVRANQALLRAMGVRGPQRPLPRVARAVLPGRSAAGLRAAVGRMPLLGRRPVGMVRWDRIADVAARHRDMLRRVARARPVAKDPRFAWTLPAWPLAGAEVEHVVLCVRPLGAMVRSRVAAGMIAPGVADDTRNLYAYGIGLAVGAVHDHRISHAVLRFPDFLERPGEVREAMRLPAGVSDAAFDAAFRAVVDPALVHDRS